MDETHYRAEAFSPITGRCFQVVSRQDGQGGWPAVTVSRSKRAKVARWRAWRSLVVPVQLFLSEQLIPLLLTRDQDFKPLAARGLTLL
jgi:hypothetical protein